MYRLTSGFDSVSFSSFFVRVKSSKTDFSSDFIILLKLLWEIRTK